MRAGSNLSPVPTRHRISALHPSATLVRPASCFYDPLPAAERGKEGFNGAKQIMKVAVTGSTGQLGTDVVEVFRKAAGVEVVPLSHEQIEIGDLASVRAALTAAAPQAVINSAAFHQVDKCEEDPEQAFRINALGAWNVARACNELGAYCVYISTDYVFDGAKAAPYDEADPPMPLSIYGASKLAGEYLTRLACPKSLVARIASVFGKSGARGKGGNFIEAILKKAKAGEPLKVVNDTPMTPTYTMDAASALLDLVRRQPTGILHVTNQPACTWYDFAKKAVDLCGLKVEVAPVTSDAFPSKVRRPTYSALSGKRLADAIGRPMRPWTEALRAYLVEKGHLST